MTALELLVEAHLDAGDLTRVEFCRRIELSTKNLSKVLTGKARLTTQVALRIAAEIKVDVRKLLAAAPIVRSTLGSYR